MNIKEHVLKEMRANESVVKSLSESLDITHEQLKDLLITYAFDRLSIVDEAFSEKEVESYLKFRYMEQ